MLPWRRKRVQLWYHPSFRLPFSELPAGMDARRADSVLTWLIDRRVVTESTLHEAPEASWPALRRVHDDAWLEALDDERVVAGVLGLPVARVPVASMVELWRRGVGATVEAALYAVEHGVVTANLMGGFHHAGPGSGAGFCALNDIAVAIGELRERGWAGRVVVVDLDAHPPDGLLAFGLPEVDIRSVGVASDWTTDGRCDIRVPPGCTDEPYLEAVDKVLQRLRGDLWFYIAGSDPLVGDPLGGLAVTEEGLRERDRRVYAAAAGRPLVVVPGGGYTRRSWRALAHSVALAVGHREQVLENYDPVARRVGRLARAMQLPEDEPLLTDADVEAMFGPTTEPRFLGHYTRHRVEHALERYGLLGALRRLGLGPLEVTVTTGEHPERVRVTGEHGGVRRTLMDLTVSTTRLDGFGVLRLEWLELADPRQEAGRLPGQDRPGLGVAAEVGSIVVETARRIGLDGVCFVPSHYHVAYMARDRATFYDPVIRGRFRALIRYLDGVPLARASLKLSTDGLPTEDGQTLRWEPSEMVHALHPSLREKIGATEREARAVERGTLEWLLDVRVAFP